MALASSPRVLMDALAACATVRGDAFALTATARTWTYPQLLDAASACADLLWHQWGVRPGDRIAWIGLNHPAQLILLFAAARIGAIQVPLNIRLASAEWDGLIADSQPRHVVHDDAYAEPARALAIRHGLQAHTAASLLDHDAASATPAGDHARPDAPVLLVYTSGTTGRPRGALHTQAQLLANMRIATQAQGITPADRVATMLPLFHVGGLCIQTLPALFAGAHVILHPRFQADEAMTCFERDRPTLTLQVPATMKALVDHPRWHDADLSSLRAVWAGSSLLPLALVRAFHARGLPVCNVYGSTETGPFSIALGPDRAMDHEGSCGWPAPEVDIALDVVHDGVGEVLVRGPNVIARYWPDTPARDAAGWFHTGDLASQAPDGSYTIVGRAKDLIISGGENIHPAEIEGALSEHPAVAECAAFGLPDATWGEAVAMAVVPRAGMTLQGDALRAYLEDRIARYKVPRIWLVVDALPKTALGKVQRQLLAQMARR